MKKGGKYIGKQFEDKFKEIRVEGKRMKTSAAVHYTYVNFDLASCDPLLDSKYIEEELEAL